MNDERARNLEALIDSLSPSIAPWCDVQLGPKDRWALVQSSSDGGESWVVTFQWLDEAWEYQKGDEWHPEFVMDLETTVRRRIEVEYKLGAPL